MKVLFLVTLIIVSAQLAQGVVYKWIDAQGVVHYGDSAPTNGDQRPVEIMEDEALQSQPKRVPEESRKPESPTRYKEVTHSEYECLSFIAVLPVMQEPLMQTLAERASVYQEGGSAHLVNAIRLLANQGSKVAQYSLAELYQHGYCVTKDVSSALALYQLASEGGSPEAKLALAAKAASCEELIKLLKEAAESGHPDAQANLALIYRDGCKGKFKDPVLALMWLIVYGKSLPAGMVDGMRALYVEEMTLKQIKEAERMAEDWLSSKSNLR